jgi:hypothetical protein
VEVVFRDWVGCDVVFCSVVQLRSRIWLDLDSTSPFPETNMTQIVDVQADRQRQASVSADACFLDFFSSRWSGQKCQATYPPESVPYHSSDSERGLLRMPLLRPSPGHNGSHRRSRRTKRKKLATSGVVRRRGCSRCLLTSPSHSRATRGGTVESRPELIVPAKPG